MHVDNLTESSFYDSLKMIAFESFFIFHVKFYEQHDGVAMGSLVAPALDNVFLFHFGTFGRKTIHSSYQFTNDCSWHIFAFLIKGSW